MNFEKETKGMSPEELIEHLGAMRKALHVFPALLSINAKSVARQQTICIKQHCPEHLKKYYSVKSIWQGVSSELTGDLRNFT